MARIDEKKDSPSNVPQGDPKKDKDSLFNFLANAVNANPGPGQTSAASVAGKADQIKRLEDTLNAQIRELQKLQKGAGPIPGGREGELDSLRAEIRLFTERLNWLESAAQQTRQMRENLRTEMDALQIQLSERQTRDSVIRSLEDTLFGQIHELQHRQKSGGSMIETPVEESTNLRAEMRACADRITRLESVIQQTHQSRETLRAELAALRAQVSRTHDDLDAPNSLVDRLGENVAARIEKFEQRVNEKLQAFDSDKGELIRYNAALRELAERVGQTELTAEQVRASGRTNDERVQQAVARLTAELAGLKEHLGEQQRALQSMKSVERGLENTVRAKVQELQQRFEEKLTLVDRYGAELRELGASVQSVAQRVQPVEPLSQRVDALAAHASRTEEQVKQFQETLIAQIRDVQNQQKTAQENFDSQRCEIADLRNAMGTVTERLGNFDAAAGHAERLKERVDAEMAALKAELSEQQRKLQAADAVVRGSEEALQAKIGDIYDHLAKSRDDLQSREAQLRENLMGELAASRAQFYERQERLESQHSGLDGLEERIAARVQGLEDQLREKLQGIENSDGELAQIKSDARMMAERVGGVESMIQQTGQIREMLQAEIAGLRTELGEHQQIHQPAEGVIRAIEETLSGKIQELRNRVEERSSHGDHHDDGIAALKAELKTITERLAGLEPVSQRLGALTARDAELDQWMKKLDESLSAKILELESQLSGRLQACERGDGESDRLRSDLGTLTTRLAQMQATSEQALSLAGGDVRAIADSMAGLKAEIEVIKSNLSGQRETRGPMDSLVKDLEETLDQRFQKLETQLGQKLQFVGSHDLEVNALKAEMQVLSRRLAQLVAEVQARHEGTSENAAGTAPTRSGSGAPVIQTPEQAGSASQQIGNPPLASTDQVKHLQDRMSAEIERVRAELREKSGRWKVRR